MVREALDLCSLAAALTVTSEHAASQESTNIVAGEGALASDEPPTRPDRRPNPVLAKAPRQYQSELISAVVARLSAPRKPAPWCE